jgi:hypothetical protein
VCVLPVILSIEATDVGGEGVPHLDLKYSGSSSQTDCREINRMFTPGLLKSQDSMVYQC